MPEQRPIRPGDRVNHPDWGPGGLLLAFDSIENGVSLVRAMSMTEANAETYVIGQGHSPAWAPDGNSLMFLTDRTDGSLFLSGQFGSWAASVQSFSLPSFASGPDWSPAGLPDVPPGDMAFAATAPIEEAYTEDIWPRANEEEPYRLLQNVQEAVVVLELRPRRQLRQSPENDLRQDSPERQRHQNQTETQYERSSPKTANFRIQKGAHALREQGRHGHPGFSECLPLEPQQHFTALEANGPHGQVESECDYDFDFHCQPSSSNVGASAIRQRFER